MNDQERIPKWHIITGSVQGAIHKSLVIPNQDAIGYYQDVPEQLPVILSVADGLGSYDFFRSDRGSRFAIQAAIESGKNLISDFPVLTDSFNDIIRENFCRPFANLWMELVNKDHNEDPPDQTLVESTEKKVSFFLQNTKGEDKDERKKAFLTAYPYSTTNITLIATTQYLIVVQIGNGDVVMIESDGQITRPFLPILQDIGVMTLAIPQCWKLFDISYRDIHSVDLPAAIFRSTDGYSHSYEEDFEKYMASVFHNFFLTYDKETIQEGINTFLDRITNEGDGDDTTIGILYDAPLIQKVQLSFPEDIPEQEDPVDIQSSETQNAEKITESELVCDADFRKIPSESRNNEEVSRGNSEEVLSSKCDLTDLFEEISEKSDLEGVKEESHYDNQYYEDSINKNMNNKKVT